MDHRHRGDRPAPADHPGGQPNEENSLITPPDCLATYAAAAIAKSDFWQTGWTGMRLGIVAYIVPFVFVFHPALILKASLGEIFVAILTASAGVILLGIGCAGYLFRPLGWGKRAWASVAGLLLLLPPMPGLTECLPDVAGLALGGLLIFTERLAAARPAPMVAGGAPEGRE